MFNNSTLAKAVRSALLVGITGTSIVTLPAIAADDVDEVERIEVTGSRIKRTDLEGASPVTVITAETMKLEANFTVADALRNSSLNSFGSFSEASGSSWQSQATIDLRGAGENRTLVLLDGRRMPGSPTMGGQSANLNAIPMATVERIEILTDGASSTYGSDAIAGVVNIILKKNFEGLTFNIGAGQRDQDEGTTSNELSVVAGMSTEKGNITVAFDHQRRKGIADGDRPYTAASMKDLDGDGVIQGITETTGWSRYGATIVSPDYSHTIASPLCNDLIAQYGSDTFAIMPADDDYGPGSEYCTYAWGNVSYNKASIDRSTVFVDTNYMVAENIEWFGRAMFVQNKSFGRFAPPAANWNDIPADNPHNPFGEPTVGLFRWVGIGTRDNNVDDYNQDYLTGFTGDLDWNNAVWEVYFHRNVADNKSIGEYYLSYGGLAENQLNNIPLDSPEGTANMKATTLQQANSTMDQYFTGIGFDMFELPGGSVAHYFGFEHITTTYSDIYDAQSEANLVGGSSGNSSQGERDITALFYEAALPVTDDVEVNLAVRYDDYSDFGNNTAPKVSVRWQAREDVVIRASYSEAFRAPGLDDLYGATTFSAEEAIDYKTGKTSATQYDTYTSSNDQLGPESSEYLNFGVAWDINDNMGLKVDYFDLSIDDVIQTMEVQTLLSQEAAGLIQAQPPGSDTSDQVFYIIRAETGALLETGVSSFNGIGFDIRGVDVNWSSSFDTEYGLFSFNMVNSFVLEYTEERGGELHDTAGWSEHPDHKAVATASWSYDNHRVSWNTNYTASTSEFEVVSGKAVDISGELDSWTIHNLTYTYDAGSLGALTFTVANLFDEDPVLSSAGKHFRPELYDNSGRDYRLSYTVSF